MEHCKITINRNDQVEADEETKLWLVAMIKSQGRIKVFDTTSKEFVYLYLQNHKFAFERLM